MCTASLSFLSGKEKEEVMVSANRPYIKQLIQDAKTKCKKCGELDKSKLTFHHRDGTKKYFDIADGPRRSIGAVKRELKKCDVYCRDCHDEIHGMRPKGSSLKLRKRTRLSGAQRRKRKRDKNGTRKDGMASTD
jgi:hypothetical protein